MKKENENFINDALKGIYDFGNVDTIIGKPIITSQGATVIPVSKVTVVTLSGKGEYGEVKLFQGNKNYPFSSGGGGVVTVSPVGFLIEKNNALRFLRCPSDTIDKALSYVDDLVGKINEK